MGNKRNHFRSSHSDAQPYFCPRCPSVYLSSEMALGHKCSSTPLVIGSGVEPWWDGCLFSCKHCGEGFPEVSDVRTHIYYEHITQKEREGLDKPLYGVHKTNYLELKTTYWKCQLCAKHGRKGKRRTLKRRYSTITSHLTIDHKKMSIKQYEQLISSPSKNVPKKTIRYKESKNSEDLERQSCSSQIISEIEPLIKPERECEIDNGSNKFREDNPLDQMKDMEQSTVDPLALAEPKSIEDIMLPDYSMLPYLI